MCCRVGCNYGESWETWGVDCMKSKTFCKIQSSRGSVSGNAGTLKVTWEDLNDCKV